MSISEAAQLMLEAVSAGESGGIYVLDMGNPVDIEELANDLIRLSGFKPGADIKVEYAEPRPGDKMFEELILEEEKDGVRVPFHKKIFITKPVEMDYSVFDGQIARLEKIAGENPDEIEQCLAEILPNYKKIPHNYV